MLHSSCLEVFCEFNRANAGCDHVDGGTSRFDRNGVIYQAICANCNPDAAGRPSFPTTAGAWATNNNAGGAGCNLGMLKFDLQLAGWMERSVRHSAEKFQEVACH